MDYTQSNGFVVDAGTGFNRHEDNAAVPTAVTEKDMNQTIWSLMDLVKAGGQVGQQFNETVPSTYKVLTKALKALFGGNVTTVNFAASPFALTADHAGMVLVDAAGGNVVINLPAANVLAGLSYQFRRVDASANTVTVNRAGADLIDEVFTSLTPSPKHVQNLRSSGAAWVTVSIAFTDAAEVKYFATSTAPPGYLKANGAAVSRTVYAALFARTGTTFGVGDGATTFNLPDGRGEFLRGLDDGRGVDAGRVFGSAQADLLKSHTHQITTTNSGTGNSGAAIGEVSSGTPRIVVASEATGGTETRPRNIALLACIKF